MTEIINGRYALITSIGEGGMGAVFKASDRLAGQTVAIKRIRLDDDHNDLNTASYNETEEDRRIILAKEFQILAGLRHPNIISVLDYGFDLEQQPFYVMTYLQASETILEAGVRLE
ncbi:MAG: serine/threonine-protein kinase PknK, partial [Chloroflexota bacterium]